LQFKKLAATSDKVIFACLQALTTAFPVIKVCLLADVAPPSGATIVSPQVT